MRAITISRWKVFLAVAGLAASCGDVWAQVVPILPSVPTSDTAIGTTLCSAAGWAYGNLGIGLAVIAVAILGILSLYGKIGWGAALVTGTGISVIFGVPAILGIGFCSANYPGTTVVTNGGLGGIFGLQSSGFLNLANTGSLSPYATGYSTVQSSYNPSNGVLSVSTVFHPPINGWIQMVVTGLPPGYSITPKNPAWSGTGVNTNGDAVLYDGFITMTGNGQYPLYNSDNLILNYNGQPVPPGTPLPAGVNTQYLLYSSWADYSAGCTIGDCIQANQDHTTINTSITTGTSGWRMDVRCGSGCIAPPL